MSECFACNTCIVVGVSTVVLRQLEVVQGVVVVPAGVAEGRPMVVVTLVATHVHHAVGGGATAHHPRVRDSSLLWRTRHAAHWDQQVTGSTVQVVTRDS